MLMRRLTLLENAQHPSAGEDSVARQTVVSRHQTEPLTAVCIKGGIMLVYPKTHRTVMAYFHCWRRIRTRIPTQILVLCRIFPLVQIRTLIP